MPHELIFATGNPNKVSEVREISGSFLTVMTPMEAGITDTDFPETSDTLEGNAIEKVNALYDICHKDCFAEDTGLEVAALDGAPGVHTARYAGQGCTPHDNIEKLLANLVNEAHRSACFRTVIALRWSGDLLLFEGRVDGRIGLESKGLEGFGYDPVFIPDGYTQSFAELPSTVKNALSHRARAVAKMLAFLRRIDHK